VEDDRRMVEEYSVRLLITAGRWKEFRRKNLKKYKGAETRRGGVTQYGNSTSTSQSIGFRVMEEKLSADSAPGQRTDGRTLNVTVV
jgi:hypothetical protein